MEAQRRNILPIAIGIVLTGLVLAGLGIISNMRRNAEVDVAPQLSILSPAPGATLDSPLVVRFTSTKRLALKPSGWGHGRLHLHATVNGIQYMPAAAELSARDTIYEWTIRTAPAGSFSLQLAWADMAHRPLQAGTSGIVKARLR
ncbi:MAG: hypothetical protein ACT4O1_06835 [Gemmatimonadota bacterium]